MPFDARGLAYWIESCIEELYKAFISGDFSMSFYRFLADTVLAGHFAYVAFVVLGLVAILLGIALRWRWVRNFWFRTVHFLMIGVVVLESLCGVLCPLTEWENRLRELAGESSTPGSFIGHWMDRILFVDLPPEVLTACYCVFGLIVLTTLILAPPRWPGKKDSGVRGRGTESDGGIPS